MADKILGTLEAEEFDQMLSAFIERVEPDTMSFGAFDQTVHRLAEEAITEIIEQLKLKRHTVANTAEPKNSSG